MHDIAAVRLELDSGGVRFFLTWGRLITASSEIEKLVMSYASSYDLGGRAVQAKVCDTLSEAVNAPYFFEGLTSITVDWGNLSRRKGWEKRALAQMKRGKALYYLGRQKEISSVCPSLKCLPTDRR